MAGAQLPRLAECSRSGKLLADAARTYPGSVTLTLPGQSHSYSGAGCLDDVISAFIDSASALDLPTDCLAQLPIPPFTLS